MLRRRKEADGAIRSVETLYRQQQTNYKRAGGFMSDDDDDEAEAGPSSKWAKNKHTTEEQLDNLDSQKVKLGPNGFPQCEVCEKEFPFSYLFDNFRCSVCDECRDKNDLHKLITRTDAKTMYMLKDCDLDMREPKLPFISKKNPHNPRWGDMKLYLKVQVQKRAVEVWGSLEGMNEARSTKEKNRKQINQKRLENKIKQLRKEVRGNDKCKVKKIQSHTHEFGPENFDSCSGMYIQVCSTCNYNFTYEKM